MQKIEAWSTSKSPEWLSQHHFAHKESSSSLGLPPALKEVHDETPDLVPESDPNATIVDQVIDTVASGSDPANANGDELSQESPAWSWFGSGAAPAPSAPSAPAAPSQVLTASSKVQRSNFLRQKSDAKTFLGFSWSR
eukprot:gb/GFBE01041793.1/.p1 GENE.gb/GFBE01041793.1/~~gb/GFBE01041793.1/.p1  ORF type:complete len:138 (+),score=18.78 gb/GFBE01041793.1/:1-414(+)